MNKFQLQSKLVANDIDPQCFSLDGTVKDECLILEEKNPTTWIVYYFERGLRTGEMYFGSESEACEYMWDHLSRDPTVKKKE
jgi:hypothetical protein